MSQERSSHEMFLPRTSDSDASEFTRRRSLPGVETIRMYGKRYITTVLKLCGREIGQRDELLKRGKVISTTYLLPEL